MSRWKARGAEIWALGLRNPHRLNWAIDPADARNNRLIVNSIGLRTWETVNIVRKGANYGYSLREGNEVLQADNKTTALPADDMIPVRVNDTTTNGSITPTYPVIQYPHLPGGGDAVGSGFLYRGTRLPALRGKYVFTDISTGRLWVRGLQRDACRRRWRSEDSGSTARDEAALERSGRRRRAETAVRFDVPDREGGLPRARRQIPDSSRARTVSGRVVPTRTSRSTAPASSISSARPMACSAWWSKRW